MSGLWIWTPSISDLAVLAEEMDLVAEPGQRRGRGWRCRCCCRCRAACSRGRGERASVPPKLLVFAAMNDRQLYRMRAPASGREAIAARRARPDLRRPRDRRGDAAGGDDPAPGPLGLLPAPHPGQPPRLPPLRPADRAGRQRLPVLRASPARALASSEGRGSVGPPHSVPRRKADVLRLSPEARRCLRPQSVRRSHRPPSL